jgi:hypothetical protein
MTTNINQQIYSKGSIISPEGNYEWEGKSDGNTGTIKLTINGTDTKIMKFSKEQLEDLFNQSTSRMSLDKRLMMDFMEDDDNYINPFKSMKNSKTSKKTTRKGKNKRRKNNKSRKTSK